LSLVLDCFGFWYLVLEELHFGFGFRGLGTWSSRSCRRAVNCFGTKSWRVPGFGVEARNQDLGLRLGFRVEVRVKDLGLRLGFRSESVRV
jgi:hypothetical protein